MHLQLRAKLIFLILINDDKAVGIEVKSLSLISSTFRPWHRNNCLGSSVIYDKMKRENRHKLHHNSQFKIPNAIYIELTRFDDKYNSSSVRSY